MFSDLKSLDIPDGEVAKITAGGVVLWEKITMLPHTNLVPTAKDFSGAILDGIGYRVGAIINGTSFGTNNSFTAVGFINFTGTVVHNIYVYGLDFSGSSYNRFYLHGSTYNNLNADNGLKDGYTSSMLPSVTKLADHYYKLTTKAYSTKVKYFAISGVTVSGLTPIVTLDEPIF